MAKYQRKNREISSSEKKSLKNDASLCGGISSFTAIRSSKNYINTERSIWCITVELLLLLGSVSFFPLWWNDRRIRLLADSFSQRFLSCDWLLHGDLFGQDDVLLWGWNGHEACPSGFINSSCTYFLLNPNEKNSNLVQSKTLGDFFFSLQGKKHS